MFIKEITLNGFKSYGQSRTLVGLDPHFNAITGLNGSGKSNILDAICFLLGSNSASQFRVTDMSELVYKKGSGGISFASVEIVFDNRDHLHKPAKFGEADIIRVERRIQLQGKPKLTINGTNVTLSELTDFFRSVQLNIHNPHFLIMQGRITKVLNMKPEETWRMIEEAAGTMVYLNKREGLKKVIATKSKQLKDATETEEELVKPRIERLLIERKNAIEFHKIDREFEAQRRLFLAVDAWENKNEAAKLKAIRNQLKDEVAESDASLSTLNTQLAESAAQIEQLEEADRGEENQRTLTHLQKEYEQMKELLSKKEHDSKANAKLIDEEEKRIGDRMEGIRKEEEKIQVENQKLLQANEEVQQGELKRTQLRQELEVAHQRVAVVITGLSGEGNEDLSWKNQLQTAEKDKDEISRRINLNNGELAIAKNSLNEARKQAASMNSASKNVMKDVETLQNKLRETREADKNLPAFDPAMLTDLQVRQRGLISSRARVQQQQLQSQAQLRNIELQYTDPGRGFDRRKIIGSVAKLLELREPDKFLAAIDAAAGGKKFTIVVEDDQTAKLLLEFGQLQRRMTILPLNKVRGDSRKIDLNAIERKVGKNKAWSAISLIVPQNNLEAVLQYAIGGVVVCADLQTANETAFDPQLRYQYVTLEGDNVNPDGIVSGGNRIPVENLTLTHFHNNRLLEKEGENIGRELAGVEKNVAELEEAERERQDWTKKLQREEQELGKLQSQCDSNSALRHAMEAERLSEEIAKLNQEIEKDEQSVAELTKKMSELKKKLSTENSAETEKKEAMDAERKVEKKMKDYDVVFEKIKQKVAACQTVLDAANDVITSNQELIANHETEIQRLRGKIDFDVVSLKPMRDATENARTKFVDLRTNISESSEAMRTAKAAHRTLEKTINKLRHELEAKQDKLGRKKEQLKEIETHLNQQFQENPWLGDEYDKLGTEQSTYKVENLKSKEIHAMVEKMKDKREKLKQSGGGEMSSDYDVIAKQHEEMLRKKKTILQDRQALEDIVEELDLKKQALIEEAVSCVNEHFGRIFGTLLTGAHCKLERERDEDGRPLESLKIRVGFGKKSVKTILWKESLSELSGGQRSLVALSLVLAMLRMNPAPIYVLDEIDAALDLNHTQNVGKMIRKYFGQSQFIIVSLKEGMFTNANCLYSITFPGGLSMVTRKEKERQLVVESADSSDEE